MIKLKIKFSSMSKKNRIPDNTRHRELRQKLMKMILWPPEPSQKLRCSRPMLQRGGDFHILKELDGLSPETMLLLWSMMERYNSESKFKIFFETLPETFNTGLSFGIEALAALEGTLLFEEIIQAKELCPHIIRYGRVDSASKALKFSLSRPCREGEQCYLSYGNFSSSHLITFYGFMPKGENLYDVIPLDIDAPQSDDFGNSRESEWTAHMVRGTWFSSNHELFNYGLPPPLLNYLRATLNGSKLPMETFVDTENEMAVLETLCSIFDPMLEGLGVLENDQRANLGWDVKLALDFKDLQRRIISSVLASCSAGLETLQRLGLKESMNAAATTEDS
ncbi:hypothetical protein AQUCO_03100083v1 [Aquilegia coerulea]|uniref:Rubisco LSMT substrate-binding domain-containing protein n=1 Tax=Aquilegia coerulea TaxID=218851 RepID=A0A2G5D0N8_AQUCA|nr:hypothetical protein AQUCO_03100083v1 [Aquilegia coerulea]